VVEESDPVLASKDSDVLVEVGKDEVVETFGGEEEGERGGEAEERGTCSIW